MSTLISDVTHINLLQSGVAGKSLTIFIVVLIVAAAAGYVGGVTTVDPVTTTVTSFEETTNTVTESEAATTTITKPGAETTVTQRHVSTTTVVQPGPTTTKTTTFTETQRSVQPDVEGKYETMVGEVMAKLSELRGLDLPETVELELVSSNWVKEQWGRPQSVEEPLEWKIYKSLLLIPAEASFSEFQEEWAGYVMAATSGTTLYIVVDIVEKAEERTLLRTLAHESTHILQYVNFQIVISGIYDSDQAMWALIEGDADLSADMLLEAEGFKPFENQDIKLEKLDYKTTLILTKSFPYMYGEGFATSIWEAGGWVLLNQAYENPPSSTEQVIHPEKYLRGEGFDEPRLLAPEGEQWELRGKDRLGEYFIRLFLARWIEDSVAKAASEGWNGDQVAYYETDGDSLLVWATQWDSEADAEEFHEATSSMLMNAGGEEIGEGLWKTNNIFVTSKLSGNTVYILSSNNSEALKQVFSKEL